MTHTTTAPRASIAIGIVALSLTTLTGCDFPPPEATFNNRSYSSVTLTLTGSEVEPVEAPAREGWPVLGIDGLPLKGAGDCEGDGFIVTDTATGKVLGTSEEPVCAETTIIVNGDGTVSVTPSH